MTDDEIRIRIAQGEDTRTQFKSATIGVAKLAAEFCAFANTNGGVIFFGVDDDGEILGLERDQKKSLDDEISNASNDTVRPALYPQTEFHTIDGKLILAVIVPDHCLAQELGEDRNTPRGSKWGSKWGSKFAGAHPQESRKERPLFCRIDRKNSKGS